MTLIIQISEQLAMQSFPINKRASQRLLSLSLLSLLFFVSGQRSRARVKLIWKCHSDLTTLTSSAQSVPKIGQRKSKSIIHDAESERDTLCRVSWLLLLQCVSEHRMQNPFYNANSICKMSGGSCSVCWR